MTDLVLQPTGSTQYEVIADGQIVGRIALFHALRNRSKPWVWSIDLAFASLIRTDSTLRAMPDAAAAMFFQRM